MQEKPNVVNVHVSKPEEVVDSMKDHDFIFKTMIPFMEYFILFGDSHEQDNILCINYIFKNGDPVASLYLEKDMVLDIMNDAMYHFIERENYEMCAALKHVFELANEEYDHSKSNERKRAKNNNDQVD